MKITPFKEPKLLLAGFITSVVFTCFIPAVAAQTTKSTESKPDAPDGRQRIQRTIIRGDNNRDERNNDDRRHNGHDMFRQFMKSELEHVPLLNQRMQRLMNIQTERYALQKRRQDVAAKPQQDRSSTIQDFHGLLRRDFQLSDESRKIAQEIIKDLPEIRKQLETRRAALDAELKKVETTPVDPLTSATDARDIRRKLRYVEFLDKKLRDLEERPERVDVLTRMLRGVPFEESRDWRPDPLPRGPKDHLEDLKSRRKELQKELRQVENEINLIQEKAVRVKEPHETAPKPQQ